MRTLSWVCLFWLAALSASAQESEAVTALAKKLRTLEPEKLTGFDDAAKQADQFVAKKLREANAEGNAAWARVNTIGTRAEWEKLRSKTPYLQGSAAFATEKYDTKKIHIVGELPGDGYKIQKLIYETRPHWFVTANLYLPEKPLAGGMPGILLSHSHHSPKTQGELQDMGATWARVGCAVLIPDHLGHGERRQHPFASAKDFDREFAVGRQDYYFRYDTSIQLYLAGESLMSWMIHDLIGGVHVLMAQPSIDAKKIAILGAVAGGGDPAAFTAAVDQRISLVAPFNFGGPQPETRYPLPDDAETSFNYAGGGSWESTRNVADSARQGFLPWVIVAGIAPRKLIYGHEFSWDREHDPVWKRFEKIWGYYDAQDNLGFAHGRGTLRGMPPEASHCDNIGPLHRSMIHPYLAKWFGVSVTEKDEFKSRRDTKDLLCWTTELKDKLQPKPLHEILAQQAKLKLEEASLSLAKAPAEKRREMLRETWRYRLSLPGDREILQRLEYTRSHAVLPAEFDFATGSTVGSEVEVPVVVLTPSKPRADKPLVVAIAQAGARGFLKKRSEEISRLLEAGIHVALVDVRHADSGNDRGQYSDLTSYSASYLMLGRHLVGVQLEDYRKAIQLLRNKLKPGKIVLWGESFAEPLAADAKFNYPRRIDRPEESDPLGALLVTLTALFEDDIEAIYANGLLDSYESVLASPFVQMPHSVLVRDVYGTGDLLQVTKNLTCKGYFPNRIDGTNQRLERDSKGKVKSPSAWLIEAL